MLCVQWVIVIFQVMACQKNDTQAFIYWRRSAKLGNPDAMFRLGDCYRFGWGVEENITSAIEWYSLAAENGSEDARQALKKL